MSRKPLLIIFITVFVDLLGFGIVLPLLPRYAEHFLPETAAVVESVVGQAPGENQPVPDVGERIKTAGKHSRRSGLILGCLMASFSAMQFLFAPLWGMVSDRIGRRPVLLVGLAGSMVFYALFALVTQWGNAGPILGLSPLVWLFVTRIGAGISGATISTAQAYIADVTDEKSRGKGMAIIGAAFGIGFIFGPLLGSMFVADNLSSAPSAAPGYVASALSGLAFLFGLTSLPESLKRGESSAAKHHGWLKAGALLRVASHRTLGRILLAIFMTTFAFGMFETTLATLTKRIGVNDRVNFFVFSYIGLVLTLAQGLLVRRLIPRLGELRMAICGVVVMTIGLLLLGQVSAASVKQVAADTAGADRAFWNLIAILPVVVVGFSATTPSLQAMLSLNSGSDEQGEVLGVGQSLSALARIAGPMVGLTLQEGNPANPYWFGAALMALGVVMVARLKNVIKARAADGSAMPTH